MTDSELQVIIRPGVPGLGFEELDGGHAGYASSADDLVKLLRERGVATDFDRPREERLEVTHKAADVWLPVIEVVRDLAIGVLGGCIVELVKDEKTRLHAKVGRSRRGATEWLELDGSRDEVIEAIDRFLEQPEANE